MDLLPSVQKKQVYDTMGSGDRAWYDQRHVELGKCIIHLSILLTQHSSCTTFLIIDSFYSTRCRATGLLPHGWASRRPRSSS